MSAMTGENRSFSGIRANEYMILQLMQDSSDAFEEADTGYESAVRNLGQGN